jgi:NDP-sugar pyrophosphorylase family protein
MIFLGKGVKVEKGAYIQGPCWIGDGTVIRSGAYVREYVLTGENCVIGHGTEVKHSIFLDRACAAHFNYVGDSILGNDVNLGAGAKCANLRFDHQMIRIRFEKNKIDTGLKKMGAILGDHAQLGCNAVSNPGTLFLPKTTCAPCMNVGGVLISSLKH